MKSQQAISGTSAATYKLMEAHCDMHNSVFIHHISAQTSNAGTLGLRLRSVLEDIFVPKKYIQATVQPFTGEL